MGTEQTFRFRLVEAKAGIGQACDPREAISFRLWGRSGLIPDEGFNLAEVFTELYPRGKTIGARNNQLGVGQCNRMVDGGRLWMELFEFRSGGGIIRLKAIEQTLRLLFEVFEGRIVRK